MQRPNRNIENKLINFTKWVGSVQSVVLHSVLFLAALSLPFFGVSFEKVLLALTTVVSLEAIYLSLFIQMSVNHTTETLAVVEKDIDEIQEDVEEMSEDVEEIQKDIDEIQEDVEDLSEEEH